MGLENVTSVELVQPARKSKAAVRPGTSTGLKPGGHGAELQYRLEDMPMFVCHLSGDVPAPNEDALQRQELDEHVPLAPPVPHWSKEEREKLRSGVVAVLCHVYHEALLARMAEGAPSAVYARVVGIYGIRQEIPSRMLAPNTRWQKLVLAC